MDDSFNGVAQLITALAVAYNIWQTWHVRERSGEIHKDLGDIKSQTNGLSEKLLQVTGDAEFAKGVKQGENNSREEAATLLDPKK